MAVSVFEPSACWVVSISGVALVRPALAALAHALILSGSLPVSSGVCDVQARSASSSFGMSKVASMAILLVLQISMICAISGLIWLSYICSLFIVFCCSYWANHRMEHNAAGLGF